MCEVLPGALSRSGRDAFSELLDAAELELEDEPTIEDSLKCATAKELARLSPRGASNAQTRCS